MLARSARGAPAHHAGDDALRSNRARVSRNAGRIAGHLTPRDEARACNDIAFTFVSDEFNGVTRDNQGNVRPLLPRTFSSLSEAEEENGQSRIYLGIHWSFDKSDGIAQGRKVADYVIANAFVPLGR